MSRLMDPFEILALGGSPVTVKSIGLGEMLLEQEDGTLVVVWACTNCDGDESHLNFGIVAESDLAET